MEREKMVDIIEREFIEPHYCDRRKRAEILLNELIPEGAVVLTREEYERLKKEELYAKGKYNLCHGDRGIEGTAKTTERLGQTLIEYDRRVREAYDNIIPQLLEENKQARKETARDIVKDIKNFLDEDDYNNYYFEILAIAMKYGVEVEE